METDNSGAQFSPKKTKFRSFCSVYGCSSRSERNITVRFHKFPKFGKYFVDAPNCSGEHHKVDRVKMWMDILKLDSVTPNTSVCSLHFRRDDYILPETDYERDLMNELLGLPLRKKLKKSAIPTLYLVNEQSVKKTLKRIEPWSKRKQIMAVVKSINKSKRKFNEEEDAKSTKRYLKSTAVPSCNLPKVQKMKCSKDNERENRIIARDRRKEAIREKNTNRKQRRYGNNLSAEQNTEEMINTDQIKLTSAVYSVCTEYDNNNYKSFDSPNVQLEQVIIKEEIIEPAECDLLQTHAVFIRDPLVTDDANFPVSDVTEDVCGDLAVSRIKMEPEELIIKDEDDLSSPTEPDTIPVEDALISNGFKAEGFSDLLCAPEIIELHKENESNHNEEKDISAEGNLLFKCVTCQKGFAHNWQLNQHRLTEQHSVFHTEEKCLVCIVCSRMCVSSSTLRRHMRIHTREKPYKCKVCEKHYSARSSLKQHMLIHTGEKPHCCDVCGRGFNNKSNMNQHVRVHTGEKPFKCDICEKCFINSSNLKLHKFQHAGKKSFKCDVCQKCFINKLNLKQHKLIIHTDNRPYKCETCEKCFALSSHLKRHMLVHAKEAPF